MRISKPPEERRAELVAAARRLFDERGVEKTRVSDIVRLVGVAQGAFYYYFTSKDEIVREVAGQVTAEVEGRAEAILAAAQAGFCEKLAGLIELALDLVDQFTADGATRLEGAGAWPGQGGAPAGRGRQVVRRALHRLVRQAAAAGEITIKYPEQTVDVLIYGLEAMAAEALPDRRMIYTLAEQALGLAGGSLLRHAPGQ